ncbi:aspartate-semialdehyde dehydrogenase [Candidatus Hydrogenisulfobacillus filiaventi]|uniref:Aspartate-semialdehyde dehydrogenase n=1 Tax=Candidatus Hydrogenisulfobacillus filiaventi TaxID=2707344 RepID=A0A6F8ZGY3_9FIRM|nr:aspartate-semialdehyde dehydrogenase [Bacillota bacterium]CAB1129024.1 aspartate-semialdehyde dehydrogenase [Candidatus Hydrogenisulfobacillus filiaventi]
MRGVRPLRVAVLGATGLVGQTILRILEERAVPVSDLVPLATEGHGRSVTFQGRSWPVEAVEGMDWSRVDVAFFAASNPASERYAPLAAAAGVTVIDKSSHFRMDPAVPLVVPEVNGDAVGDSRIIASPNCSTIQLVVALNPIRQAAGLERVLVSTYQAVSGTGREAMETLDRETRARLAGEEVAPSTYPTHIAFNVLPYCDRFGDLDYTGEEWKLTRESAKIFAEPIPLSATAVRVPVLVSHAEAVYVETREPISVEAVRDLLARAPGVRLVDDPARGLVPTPEMAAGQDDVLVGRIRRDPFHPRGLHLFVVADNLRKGAATNAVQILESLSERWLAPARGHAGA